MRQIPTQIRVHPLRSSDMTSTKFSLSKSLAHDTRKTDETHVDKSRSHLNISWGNPDDVFDKIKSLKERYGTVTKRTTIDCANFVTTVNKSFFEQNPETSQEMKQIFLDETRIFLQKEMATPDAVLYVVGHDDEDGFHVHSYVCPVVGHSYKNRHADVEKITINYRGKYSDSQSEINTARKENKSSELKLGELQTRWAEHISETFPELVRGKKDSGKKHITPKEYRKMIQEDVPNIEQKIKKNEEKVMQLNMEIYRKKDYVNTLDKEIENRLRNNVTINEVAKLCGMNYYPEKITKDGKEYRVRNAIDYLTYVQGCSFKGAVGFLHENFGENATKNELYKDIKQMPNDDITPKYISTKESIINKEFKALGNPIVRLTATKIKTDESGNIIYDEKGKPKKETIVIGKDRKTGDEKFYNRKEVLTKIKQLNFLNASGYNIFITPIEYAEPRKFVQIVVDDVKDLHALKQAIGEPNIVIESSKENYQCLYNIPNEIVYKNSLDKGDKKFRRRYLNFFNEINHFFGDENISGLRHAFRLAGFANQKPNRAPVFAKIISTSDAENHELAQLIMSDKYNMKPKDFRQLYINQEEMPVARIADKL